MRQRSRGKDTKSLGIKTLLGEKTAKKLQISEKVLYISTGILRTVSHFATPSFVKKMKIIAVVCGKMFESQKKVVNLWAKDNEIWTIFI